ncbi:MAG: pantoate--beta-alanine ligase [Phycisphaerae bacterium]|nr:pantoate--beta-alanine ligase [Phycisphaerae bacterium]
MHVVRDIDAARKAVHDLRREFGPVGLVPTMGALHEGHVSLIRASMQKCESTAVSIFLNPTQFAPGEDLSRYPANLEVDLDVCREEGARLVFTPDVSTMYPGDDATVVHVRRLGEGLCGRHRPGHFDGVATVVAKLFQIMPADYAFFGEKDYQQLLIVEQMVRDLNIPIEIVRCPTVRTEDGLALSSRNVYLSPAERKQAASLNRALFDAVEKARHGETDAGKLREDVIAAIKAAGPVDIDYVEVVDAGTLEPLSRIDRPGRICLAVRIGQCRLIDNVAVDVAASQP